LRQIIKELAIGFANTDLDRLLKQHDIERIVVIGMIANTCIESTSRFGMGLGYPVTLVRRDNERLNEKTNFGMAWLRGSSAPSILRPYISLHVGSDRRTEPRPNAFR
jgi:hypothetical protein